MRDYMETAYGRAFNSVRSAWHRQTGVLCIANRLFLLTPAGQKKSVDSNIHVLTQFSSSLQFLLTHYILSSSLLTSLLSPSLSPSLPLCSSGSMVSGWRWLWMTGCQYAKAVCSSATLAPAMSFGAPWWKRPMPSQFPQPAYVSGL